MKKTYIKPEIILVDLSTEKALMAASAVETVKLDSDVEVTSADNVRSKSTFDLWADDEE